MNRCKARDRNGHRCNRRGFHPDAEHSAFGRWWDGGSEKLHPGKPRKTTPGWSRRGMTGTRTEIRATRSAKAV